ncbi:MAG TPA: hypothetical protein VFY93_08510 [Planctomycetota bacterium]|nr:hypothetical protein [Planctomycetota bacterium]
MSFRQYRALVRTFLRIAWRGPAATDGARVRRGALAGGFLGYLVIGLVMMFLAGLSPEPRMGGFLLQSMSFMMVALALLNIYGDLVFDARDVPLLFWRPIDPRAYLAARLTAIAVYFAAVTTVINLPGAVVLALRFGPAWYPAAHMLGAFAGSLAAILLALLLLFVLLRAIGRERLRDTVAWVQIVVTFLFLGGNQLLSRARFLEDATPISLFVGRFALLMPMSWAAAIADMAAGRALPGQAEVALLGVAVPLGMAAILVTLFGRTYADVLRALGEGDAKREKPASRGLLRPWFERAASGDPASRAGFLLSWATIRRARDFKVRALPQFGLPVIFAAMTFLRSDSSFSAIMAVFLPSMLALSACNGLVCLIGSPHADARWAWRVAPLAAPAPALRGGALAVLGALVLPVLVGLAVLAAVALPPLEAAGFVALSAGLSVAALRVEHGWIDSYPCSVSLEDLRRKMMGLEILAILIGATVVAGVALALRGWIGGWGSIALAAPLLAWGWHGLARRTRPRNERGGVT